MTITRRDARCGLLRVVSLALPCARFKEEDANGAPEDVSRASRSSRDDGTASEGARAGTFTDSRDGSKYSSYSSYSSRSSEFSDYSSSAVSRSVDGIDDERDDDERDGSGTSASRSDDGKSESSTDSQATVSDASDAGEEGTDVLVGAATILDESVGDVTSTKVECGPDASEETIEAFVSEIDVVRDPDAFGGGMRERELFKKALAKQVIFNQGERVLAEGQSWSDEEAMKGGYCVYFVVRGACAATKLVHPRHPRAHTPEALEFVKDPMSVLRPIPTQFTHLNNDAYSATPAIRQRAMDLKRADDSAEVEVAKFIRGAIIGDYEVLRDRIPRRCTVTALVDNTALAVMRADVFEKICRPGTNIRERVDAEHGLYV